MSSNQAPINQCTDSQTYRVGSAECAERLNPPTPACKVLGRVRSSVRKRQESSRVPSLAEPRCTHRRVSQHEPAPASTCQPQAQTPSNTDTKSTWSVSEANFIQHKLEHLQDSLQDPKQCPKMASKSYQNCIRDPQLGPSYLQDGLWDLAQTS